MKKALSLTREHELPVRSEPVLSEYIAQLHAMVSAASGDYASHEHALLLPLDRDVLDVAINAAKQYGGTDLKYVVVIGIGGSNLGTKAVYDALHGGYDLALSRKPKLLFLDTLSSQAMRELGLLLDHEIKSPNEILINLVSKSGKTVESVANFGLCYGMLKKRFADIDTRVVCTTDIDSALWKEAKERGFGLLPIPAMVGGRYSVFSAVGIFPLLLAGIDVEEFRKGGAEMLHDATAPEENHAKGAGEELFAAMGLGYNILNIFHFNPELESLGKWERQLIAESLGKEKDRSGEIVHAGITPIVSIGSTDLHSMAQLYFGGPRDKFSVLIRADESDKERVPGDVPLVSLAGGASGKKTTEIMEAIFEGVKSAYVKNKLPFVEVRLPKISPHTLGLYMEWRMATTIYLAKLMNVDPFDQPNVEDYKSVTRALLEH